MFFTFFKLYKWYQIAQRITTVFRLNTYVIQMKVNQNRQKNPQIHKTNKEKLLRSMISIMWIVIYCFFCTIKWKYEADFKKSHHISRNCNGAVCCYTENMQVLKFVDVINCGINLKKLFSHILATIFYHIYIYKSSYQVKLKSGNLLTIPLCPNLLDWIFKIFSVIKINGFKTWMCNVSKWSQTLHPMLQDI